MLPLKKLTNHISSFSPFFMDNKVALFFAYTIAYIIVTLVGVYILNLPGWITESYDLVKEFYIKNGAKNIIIEWFVFLVYIGLAHIIITHFKIKDNLQKIIVISFVTLILSTFASLIFTNTPSLRGTFFQKWFIQTGIKSIIYDIIIITTMFIVFHKLLCKFKYHNLI